MTDLTDTSWLELSPDAVVLVDSGGVIRYANRMCDTLLGWRAERDLDCMCRDAWRWQSENPGGYDR